jgi:hypothetical protein
MSPKYIKEEADRSAPVDFEWNDKFPALNFSKQVPALQKQVAAISARGVVALAAAKAEWIVGRLSKASDDVLPSQCIEAVWAAVCDWRYFKVDQLPNKADWTGPSRGALLSTMKLLNDIVDYAAAHQGAYVNRTVELSNLYEYTTKDVKAFRAWRKKSIERLQKLFPYEKGRPDSCRFLPKPSIPMSTSIPRMRKQKHNGSCKPSTRLLTPSCVLHRS